MIEQVYYPRFMHLGLTQPFSLGTRSAEVSPAAGMVIFKLGLTLAYELVRAQSHEQVYGTPVEVVLENYSDEVTLPNSRPRNSP
jgi:hypothetical protein